MMYEIPDSPKMLRETLCVAQNYIGNHSTDRRASKHICRLQRLIDECDRHRPLGVDGKHSNLHTETCGCEDKGPRETWATVTKMEKGPQIDSKNELCPKDGRPLWWHVSIGGMGSRGVVRTNGWMINCDFGANDVDAVLEAQMAYNQVRNTFRSSTELLRAYTPAQDLPISLFMVCNECSSLVAVAESHTAWHKQQESPNDICVVDNYTREYHDANDYKENCKFKRG